MIADKIEGLQRLVAKIIEVSFTYGDDKLLTSIKQNS